MGSGAPVDLALREALDVLHAPDLCPLLHVKQRLPPVSILRSSQIQRSGRMAPAPRRSGPLLDRRRWTSIQAAPTAFGEEVVSRRSACSIAASACSHRMASASDP